MSCSRRFVAASGLTLLEVLFATAAAFTLATLAVPLTSDSLDDIRSSAAARYMAARIMAIRMEAIRRSASTALRFEAEDDTYVFAPFVDGNGNGVRTAEMRDGIDKATGGPLRLHEAFPGVRFGLIEGVPDADGNPVTSLDGVRIGTAKILTMSPDGTATSGTLYVRGRRAQYAVRVLGITGRTRVLQYHWGERRWVAR